MQNKRFLPIERRYFTYCVRIHQNTITIEIVFVKSVEIPFSFWSSSVSGVRHCLSELWRVGKEACAPGANFKGVSKCSSEWFNNTNPPYSNIVKKCTHPSGAKSCLHGSTDWFAILFRPIDRRNQWVDSFYQTNHKGFFLTTGCFRYTCFFFLSRSFRASFCFHLRPITHNGSGIQRRNGHVQLRIIVVLHSNTFRIVVDCQKKIF